MKITAERVVLTREEYLALTLSAWNGGYRQAMVEMSDFVGFRLRADTRDVVRKFLKEFERLKCVVDGDKGELIEEKKNVEL